VTGPRRLAEAQVALMLLTRFPVGRISGNAPTLADARWAYPLAGLPVGLAGWCIYVIAAPVSPLLAAALAMSAMALATGGLHHDGLADFADGMGGQTREQRLEIMRDSRIGSFGVIALIFVVILGVGALSELPSQAPLAAIFLLNTVASRLAMLSALDMLPPARSAGLGQSATGGSTGAWLPGLLLIAILTLTAGAVALAILCAVALIAVVVMRVASRNLGGQTGDVLGAVQVLAETAGWVATALFGTVLLPG
jgi:adenosylcobinamide-GDP ribazoletransferase